MMDTSAIDTLLSQLRATAAQASGPGKTGAGPAQAQAAGPDFATLLKNSLDGINSSQVESTRLAREFELGAKDVSLNDVMISMQKANISWVFGKSCG